MNRINPLPGLAALGLACALVTQCVLAQDWPQWRGPNRDGKAAAFNAPKTWPKAFSQKWKVTVGEGVSTPSLVGDRLYVFSRESGAEITRCLDTATGKELWQEKYDTLGASGPASSFSGPRASPAVADGKVVTSGARGMLSCLEAKSGKLLWRKEDLAGAYPTFYAASSPLIEDGLCVAQVGGKDKGGVLAFDVASGKEKWKWAGEAAAYASPVLMTIDGTKFVIAETETKIVALALADGKLAWETPFAVQGRGGYNAATPVIDGTTLIYSGSGRGAAAVKLGKKGDGLGATELWKNPDNSVVFNSPILKNGFLYGFSAANEFFCVNAQDGKTAWTAPSAQGAGAGADSGGGGGRGRGMGRGGFGSIVDAGAVLLALSPASQLIAFEPSEKAYQELARIKVADTPTHAYPVVSGNRVFIKDQDSVTLWTIP